MKKGLSILLAIIMILSFTLTACQSKKTETGSESQGGNKPLERVKLRILAPSNVKPIPDDVDPQNNIWIDIYKKAFPEVDFEFVIIPQAEAAEKKTLMMYTGDFPDMVYASQKELVTWSQEGIIIPLDDIIKKYYPNLNKFVKEDEMTAVKYEGKYWALPIPSNRLQNPDATYIRKDWLDKLNLKMPATLDELCEVMKAFVTKDPDGNGKDDTFGISGEKNLNRMWEIYSPFDVQPGWYTRVNGKLMPDSIRPEMREALTFLRKLYADGLMDKETLTQSAKQLDSKALQGTVGVYANNTWNMSGSISQQLMKDKGGVYASLTPLKGPKGIQQIHSARDVGRTFAVTTGCKNPEYPAKILNWSLEQDKSKSYFALNCDLLNCGEVGLHGLVTGKYITNLPDNKLNEQAERDKYRYNYRLVMGSMNVFTEADQIAHAEELVKAGIMSQNWVDDKKNVARYGKPNGRIFTGPIATEKEDELNSYFTDIKNKIVSGALPLDAFDKWVEYFNQNGGKEIIDETNKLNHAK